jgi:hypothetical protein
MKYKLLDTGITDQPSSNTIRSTPTQPGKEDWGDYITRNLAKVPTLAYETARSGLGIGGAALKELHRFGEEIEEGAVKQFPFMKSVVTSDRELRNRARKIILPTMEEAREETRAVLPAYYSETRPGDAPAEFLLKEVPLLFAGGALKSVPSLLKGLTASAGILAGSEAGHRLGGYIGKQLGGERGEQKGAFLGSLGGGAAGGTLAHVATNRPSKFFEEKYLKNAEYSMLDKDLGKAHKELIAKRDKSLANLKEEATKRETRIDLLEKSRHPEYAKAEEAAKNIKEPAPEIQTVLKKIEKDIGLGVEKSEQSRIGAMAAQLENILTQTPPNLSELVTLQKNLNAAIYDKTLPPVTKKYYVQMRNTVNDALARIGKQHPEHGKPFSSAEAKTAELKRLRNEESDFNTHQKQTQREINKNYSEDVRNLNRDFRTTKESLKAQEKFAKQWGGLIGHGLSQAAAGGLSWFLEGILGFGIKGKAITHLIAALAKEGYKDVNAYSTMFREHPDLLQDYNQIIKNVSAGDKFKIAQQAKIINDKFDKYAVPRGKRYKLVG